MCVHAKGHKFYRIAILLILRVHIYFASVVHCDFESLLQEFLDVKDMTSRTTCEVTHDKIDCAEVAS